MKEATGELNMTVVTVVAIAAVAAFFYAFVWPNIKESIAKNTCESSGGTYEPAQTKGDGECNETGTNIERKTNP